MARARVADVWRRWATRSPAVLAVGHAITHEEEIAPSCRIGFHRIVLVGVHRVVHELRSASAEAGVRDFDRWTATVQKNQVVPRNQRSKRSWRVDWLRESRGKRLWRIDVPECDAG